MLCVCPGIRGQRLEESLEYQQFVANVEEEEAWINEKMTLVASEDYGDTLAAIQVRAAGAAACRLVRWLHSCPESSRPAASVSLVGRSPPDLMLETRPRGLEPAIGQVAPGFRGLLPQSCCPVALEVGGLRSRCRHGLALRGFQGKRVAVFQLLAGVARLVVA